jgi:hypothetical protein
MGHDEHLEAGMIKNGVQYDTFLVSDPIKPYHINNDTLSYKEIDRRRKVMDENSKLEPPYKLDDEFLAYLLSDNIPEKGKVKVKK